MFVTLGHRNRGNDFGDDRARLEMGDNDSFRVYFEPSHVPVGRECCISSYNTINGDLGVGNIESSWERDE